MQLISTYLGRVLAFTLAMCGSVALCWLIQGRTARIVTRFAPELRGVNQLPPLPPRRGVGPPNSPIRRIDFGNVAYPNYPDYETGTNITLKRGEAIPVGLNFGDLTGDGAEEAMAILSTDTGFGTAIVYRVYIFTLSNGKLKLLWDFDTGDRADGGVRDVYADRGGLVIELYGKDRVVGGERYGGEEAMCCPSTFTRTRYHWLGGKFKQISSEVLPNPDGSPIFVTPEYETPPMALRRSAFR
jgi:hypothetical protein